MRLFMEVSPNFLRSLILILFAGAFCSMARADDAEAKRASADAGSRWLVQVDDGRVEDSWKSAAAIFQRNVSEAQWRKALSNARDLYGALRSRELGSSTYTKTLPGVPAGEYVVLQFRSVFERQDTAVETVTTMKDKDGQWRVAGYLIQ